MPINIKTRKDIFKHIYSHNLWTCPDTVSGWGSTISNAKHVMVWLPKIVRTLGANTLLDIPCGDLHWMSKVDLGVDLYIGADIIENINSINKQRYGNTSNRFIELDICIDNLPSADILFCRDCLVHLSLEDMYRALLNIINGNFKYLITTTYETTDINIDIRTGDWRPINFKRPPFCWPNPIAIIKDNNSIYGENDWGKCLSIWKVNDIRRRQFYITEDSATRDVHKYMIPEK